MFKLKVPQLLTALIGLATITLGIVAYDAERLISAVDALRAAQQEDHNQIMQNTVAITQITPRVDSLEVKVGDLNGRVIRLEPRP